MTIRFSQNLLAWSINFLLDPLPVALASVLFLCCRVLPFHFSSSQVWNDLHAVLDAPERPHYGWKKGAPLFFGIFSGYYVVQMICAVFVYGVSALLPGMLGGMKYVGAAYILWLAAHIAVSRPDRDGKERSASFLKGFMLQFVNVKIYLFGITALTGYVTNYSTALPVLVFFE